MTSAISRDRPRCRAQILIRHWVQTAGVPFQNMRGVGKTAQSGANCQPLAIFLLFNTLKIEKTGVGKRQSGTARGGQLHPPATPKVRRCLSI